jgi:hypothetical protein
LLIKGFEVFLERLFKLDGNHQKNTIPDLMLGTGTFFHQQSLAIAPNIFFADVSQVAECFEPQFHNFLIERIQLTEGWNVSNFSIEKINSPFKGTLSWNQSTKPVGDRSVVNFDAM